MANFRPTDALITITIAVIIAIIIALIIVLIAIPIFKAGKIGGGFITLFIAAIFGVGIGWGLVGLGFHMLRPTTFVKIIIKKGRKKKAFNW